jgi:uncharacterized protein YecT (DUF1311 family)
VEPERQRGVQEPVRKLNWTTFALVGALILLVLIVAYFATRGNADQDKLTNSQVATAGAPDPEKLCAGKGVYDLIKRELFRRAAQLRGSDQAAYDKLATYAVLRMDNPVMESEDSASSAVSCSGSLALDLPPGVAAVGGRRSLMSDVDYTIQPAADGSGSVVQLRNADAIIASRATLARVSQPAPAATAAATVNEAAPVEQRPSAPAPIPPAATAVPPLAPPQPAPAQRPSFSCVNLKNKVEAEVCSDAGLATLDRNMAAQYSRALDSASPEQREQLRRTGDRFLRYRDRCPNRQCIGDAYVGRMREIRDIIEGQAPR